MYRNIFLVLLTAPSMIAGTIQYSWNASPSDIQIDNYEQWNAISIDGGMPVFANGYPNLPAVPVSYVLPQGTTVTGVEVTNISTVSLGRALLPAPVMIVPLSGDMPDFPNYTEVCLEGMSGSFPSSSIAGYKTGTKTGFRIGSYSFVPFRYNRATGELFLVTSANIKLTYEYDPEAPEYCLTETQTDLAKTGLSTFIDNPEMLDSRAPSHRPDTDEDIEVIVVGDSLQSVQLDELVSLHNTLGYTCNSVTVQWIASNVDGYDPAEKIRNYIKQLYEDHGLVFAVIVGDRGETTRLSQLDFPYETEPMNSTSDLYFSDMDGTWDGNGNHLYGEEFDGMDYYSDIYVGRYPTKPSETDDLSTMIEKAVQYNATPVSGSWQTRALLMGAVLFPTQPEGAWRWGSKYCDSLASFFPSDWEWNTVYEDTTGYHPNNQLELFNQGTSFATYTAHGDGNGFYWYYPSSTMNPFLTCDSIPYMYNGDMLPWVVGLTSCNTGNLAFERFAESLVEHAGGGAIVAIASSQGTFGGFTEPGPAGWMSIYFTYLLFDQGLVTAGVAHGISKDMFWANWNSFYIPRMAEWALQNANLYGDPCTVFVGAPEGVGSETPQQLNTQISPNPVLQTMNVSITLAEPAFVHVAVYDMRGRVVLANEEEALGAGEHSLTMDASSLASGIYMVSTVAGDYTGIGKCVVLH